VTAALLLWLLATPAEAASCDGPACMQIRLEQVGACVWVRSTSRDRVDIEARLAQGPVTLALEAADPKKADAQASTAKAGPGGGAEGARPCERALASEKMLNDQRRQGVSIPYNPQIDGVAAECRRAAAAAAKPAPTKGEHTYVFDPMFPQSKGTPVYRAPLVRDGACVARPEDVQGYVTRYPDRPETAAPAKPPGPPCTGNACGSVVFTEDCLARNTGSRPVSLKVHAMPTLEVKSLRPGDSVKLNTFHTCLKPKDITRSEVNFVE
jgi:hypothetical protein